MDIYEEDDGDNEKQIGVTPFSSFKELDYLFKGKKIFESKKAKENELIEEIQES